jgi:hypothetical protein
MEVNNKEVNMQGTFREHSVNMQGTFREHLVNMQGTSLMVTLLHMKILYHPRTI